MQQEWHDLLFLHWEIDAKHLQSLIPSNLEVDTFEGSAWLAIVPFSMRGVSPRACPKPSFLSDFPEINIRTYVIKDGKPGVWFFSLDVPNQLPVWLARTFFHLPYFKGQMDVQNQNGETRYDSRYERREFRATYSGSKLITPQADSFEHWSTERYCLYSQSRSGQLHRAEVQHPKWPLQKANVHIEKNSMLDNFKVGSRHPSALFAKEIPVVAWWPQKC
nr:DUF2071 domain-containing protein [Pelagicoccus albus]